MRENDFLDWIQRHSSAHPSVPLHIGDDMAAVTLPASATPPTATALLKIDQSLDTIHFDLRQHSAAQAATKAVNRCLSDCAAMACLPAALLISVALPQKNGAPHDNAGLSSGGDETFAQELFLAAQAAAAKFDCPLVGGDTATWPHPLAITVAALGKTPTIGGVARYVTRSDAKPGDTLFVSGQLGGSILGRHLTFTPRIHLAQKILAALGEHLHAMMDLSDGLAQDLPRLCKASNVGAQVLAQNLPIHPDAWTLAEKDHLPAGLHALADGEDYELLFAVDSDHVDKLIHLDDVPLTAIGLITEQKTLHLLDKSHTSHPWPNLGWEHGAT
ncbi:MAG: thiamine-phosphate kinase [Phycisphaerales bacterium]|nr:thiamine-phosphate kinase [Phycisphaerales bacterium]